MPLAEVLPHALSTVSQDSTIFGIVQLIVCEYICYACRSCVHYSRSSGFSEYSECASGDVGEVGGAGLALWLF